MPLTPTEEAARQRLATFYNGSVYNASTNPGGMASGGHIINFEPSLHDLATVGKGSADLADSTASAAAASATAAATQATNAAASATAANNSKNAAATSATAASGSQSAAATSATNAATSATNAGTAATNAATSATTATTQATNAAGSASTASSAATSASTSATNAGTSATNAANSASAAAASATTAANQADALKGTSATSVVIGTGTKNFTTQSGKAFIAGTAVMITSNADPANRRMNGVVSSYSGTSLVVNVDNTIGSGTYTDWTIRLSGPAGIDGSSGWSPTLAGVADGARRVLQVTDWVGGTGSKPATGVYLSPTGFTSTIGDATDVRGASGSGSGDVTTTGSVTTNNVALFADGTGDVIKAGGTLATVATSGSYADLSSKPTIPTVPGDIGAAAAIHSHAISDVTGLSTALTNKQDADATLTAIAGVTTATGKMIYFTALDTAAATDSQAFGRSLLNEASATSARTTLGLGTAATAAASSFQAQDPLLDAIAALVTSADKMTYSTGPDTVQQTDLSPLARTLLGNTTDTAMRSTLGLGTAATSAATAFQAADTLLNNIAGLSMVADRYIYGSGSSEAVSLGTITSFARGILDDADATTVRATIGLNNVDNTTDIGKPISTLTQNALDLKLNSADQASVSEIRTGTNDTKFITAKDSMDAMAFQTLTDGATINWDMAAGFDAKVTIGATGRTLGNPTNYKDGMDYKLAVIQDGTGNRTITTWPTSFIWGAEGTPTLSTAAGSIDLVVLSCVDATTPKFVASFKKGS